MVVRRTVSTVVRVGYPNKPGTRIGGQYVSRQQECEAYLGSALVFLCAVTNLVRIADVEHLLEAGVRENLVRIFVMRLVLIGLSADSTRRRNLGHSAQHFPALCQNGILFGAVILAATERVEHAAGVDVEA